MLITKLKPKETIEALICGKAFAINCRGCSEVSFPEAEAKALQDELQTAGRLSGILTTDYTCNPENLALRLESRKEEIEASDTVLVFGCGVGVQTIAGALEEKRVCAACDTIALPGFQGVTPLEYDCGRCGECYLNLTGGICPITACTKGLVNGQCGGAKNGKCEASPDMECGWERIVRRLTQLGRLDVLNRSAVQIRNYALDERVSP